MEPPILPDDLRHIKPFLDRAAELSTRDPAVSYYCKYYAAQLAIGQQKRSKEATVWLGRLLDELEQLKRNPPPNAQEAISSETVGSAHVENFALKVFLSADNEDRAGKATKRTALTFMAASLFLETLKVFGELDQQIVEKIRYAKWKATDISRALKEGRVPAAGPPSGGEEDAGDDANNDGQGTEAGGAADLLPTVPQTQPQAPAKPPVASASTAPSSKPTVFIDPSISETVQKHCRYTISAMQYDDIPTAISNLEKALALLKSLPTTLK